MSYIETAEQYLAHNAAESGADALIKNLISEAETYRDALIRIKEGKGRFSSDPLKFASNVIEDMKDIATVALNIEGM